MSNYQDNDTIISNISTDVARDIINKYIGFEGVGKYTSGATTIILIISVIFMAITFSYLVQNTIEYNDWRRPVAYGTFMILLTFLVAMMITRYSYNLVNGGTAIFWIILYVALFIPPVLYLYYQDSPDKNFYNEDWVRWYGAGVSIVGIALAGSPLSCQIANIVFNYSDTKQKSVGEQMLTTLLNNLPLDKVQEITEDISAALKKINISDLNNKK